MYSNDDVVDKGCIVCSVNYLQYILVFLLICIWWGKSYFSPKEGFTQNAPFILKQNDDIYDLFYMEVYDKLYIPSNNVTVISNTILEKKLMKKQDKILLLSVTGDQGNSLQELYYKNVHIINKSSAVVDHMKKKFPSVARNIKCGDVYLPMTYEDNTLSCVFITDLSIYMHQNRIPLLQNIQKWLLPYGTLLIEFVEPRKFSTILPAAREFIDLEKYTKERITANEVDFESFTYANSYIFQEKKNNMIVTEIFVDKINKFVRQNEQTLYMLPIDEMISELEVNGFIAKERIVVEKDAKFIYVFKKTDS